MQSVSIATPEPYGNFSDTKITLTQGETTTFTVSGGVENSTNFVYTVNGERPDGSGLSISSWSGITVSGKSTFSKTFTIDARSGGDFYTPGTYTLELWVRDASAHTSESVDTMTVVVQKATTEPEFTAKFTDSTKTITLGERWLIEGSISVSGGSGYLGKVTINSDSVAGSSMTQDFTDHNFDSVEFEYWYAIDTTVAPWNTPGTYNLRVWAKDTNGTGGTAALASMTITITDRAAGASLPNSLYLQQSVGGSTCTLVSAIMMIRARAYLSGSTVWSDVTEAAAKPTLWTTGGLYLDAKYSWSGNSVSIKAYATTKRADGSRYISESDLKSLLDKHPEGIVLYWFDKPHAVFVTDYVDNTFYCADPAGSYSGKRMRLDANSVAAEYGWSQSELLANADQYWCVTSYSISK